MALEKKIDWVKVYSTWRTFFTHAAWSPKVSFTPVLVSSPSGGLRIRHEICDWWPSHNIPHRRRALEEHGTMGVYWKTNKGTYHTAELLYECKDDPEAQAAILIAASMWDKMKALPDDWGGEVYDLADDIFHVVVYDSEGPFKKRDFNIWHHAMRDALPGNIATDDFAKFSKPKQYSDFVYIAFLEATLITSLWTLVIVSHKEQP